MRGHALFFYIERPARPPSQVHPVKFEGAAYGTPRHRPSPGGRADADLGDGRWPREDQGEVLVLGREMRLDVVTGLAQHGRQ